MKRTVNPPVFLLSSILLLALVLFAIGFPETAQAVFGQAQAWITENASWFYILAVAILLLAVVFMGVSRYGDIKLGPDHSVPDFANYSWFAMLFSAGMGIGLMFFGVAEPVMHYLSPPVGEGGSAFAASEAMKITFFHWGLHAWAIYAIVALILAYFGYRHDLPLTLRSALYPLIGERIYGPIGHAVDIFAVLGTVLGVATSLGFGVAQINSGLNYLFDVPVAIWVQVVLIVVAMVLATISLVSGLDRGIRILSETNLLFAVLLMIIVLVLGPTVFILKAYVENTGGYLAELVDKTFNLYAYEPSDWIGGWTLFYWGWWIAWSPFVGMFIARISRGRTIRQFVSGVMLVPAGFTLAWMTVFGDTAIYMIHVQDIASLGEAVEADSAQALFAFLEHFPLGYFLSLLAMLMVLVFFVTSADSGALVVDMLASGGRNKTPLWQKLFWATTMAAIAIALLLADGLTALQTATIASALPYTLFLLAATWGLLKALRLDATKRRVRFQSLSLSRAHGHGSESWQRRLRGMVMMPRRSHVARFIQDTVTPACEAVAEELRKQGFEVEVDTGRPESVSLVIRHPGEPDFLYGVRPRAYVQPSFVVSEDEEDEARKYFRAEVYLREGGQDYDIMGWNRDGVIGDILDQYERHRHFVHVVR
ncbi:choline transporter [Pseudomonas flexibilis]|uniref:Choline transporter n=1 Tax=Pseudomonas flexibilis TaxID=706570 RepID=A0A0B3BSA2_9PSED|nr:choline BCCT transporter BetT [Pseudomonas flexibilis]KHL69897.1 choline transporter [Pseudomonas flexibilis]KHO65485.1 choline transporter [Pseudomonas flexibilis]SCX82189.1 choline/glycine/proline betaine transport protein [Pseudomonas flexibilis]SIQ54579.1 choline/glycine/proline betaine transport protein [Pseudomonas flexibilis]